MKGRNQGVIDENKERDVIENRLTILPIVASISRNFTYIHFPPLDTSASFCLLGEKPSPLGSLFFHTDTLVGLGRWFSNDESVWHDIFLPKVHYDTRVLNSCLKSLA